MVMADRKEVDAYIRRLNDHIKSRGGGKMVIRPEELREIVREDPEMTVVAVRAYLEMGPFGRGYLQLAGALAGAYEAEFHDDSLSRLVGRHLKEVGAEDAVPEIEVERAEPPAREPPAPEPPRAIQINVDRNTLESGDNYGLVINFSVDRRDPANYPTLIAARGRCFLTFEVPRDDPREVWQVPEVRRFVAGLARALPYFPYFLSLIPELGNFFIYFASLADPEALLAGPGIDLNHPSVVRELIVAVVAIKGLCERLGDDAQRACRDLLATVPPELRDRVLSAAGLGDS
jgi:hypothetical protein